MRNNMENHTESKDFLRRWKTWVLTSDTSGKKAESFETIPYVNTTKSLTHVTHEFRTPSNAHYANISPVIYGHWGDKNLNMQAWVDNLSLIEVLGKPETPVPNGVRYIRDWTNKANNSTSNVWTEIQAIERNTGINRAQGILPTTDIQNPTWNLSRLTDGSITTWWTGKSGGKKLSYMQLDLWDIYDIAQVKVWHYQDGRVFSDTKTEVSPDGINWTTLHDAAIHGTYNEPRDGSGRSYGVRTTQNTSQNDEALREFETFLEELFSEVGIESIGDEEWVEVNSSFTLSENQKSAIDRFIKKLIDTRWEKLVKTLQDVIPKLKSKDKYSSNSRQVMLDYLEVSIEKQIEINIIYNVSNTTQWWISWMGFEVGKNLQWKIGSIWIQYIDWNGIKKNKELDIQADGKYMVAFSQVSCFECSNLKPYYLLSWRTDEVVAFLDEQVVVANSSYTQFINTLKSIWNWKGYDKEYNRWVQKIVDIKEDVVSFYKDVSNLPKDVFVTIALNAIVYVWDWEVWPINFENRLNYDIAAYLLDIFLHQKGNKKFDTNHWVSQELRKTPKYAVLKQTLLDGDYDLKNWEELLVSSWSDSFNSWDLYYWIHLYDWRISVYKDGNGKIYSIIEFEDEYDFAETKYTTKTSDVLNNYGYHFQERLEWNKFTWTSESIELIR